MDIGQSNMIDHLREVIDMQHEETQDAMYQLREMATAHKIERDRNIRLEEMEKENRDLLAIERKKYDRVCEVASRRLDRIIDLKRQLAKHDQRDPVDAHN